MGYVYDFGDGWTHRLTVTRSSLRSRECRMGGPFDPAAFDLDDVNEALAELAWRPLAAPAS
jgi:hypothetical protein